MQKLLILIGCLLLTGCGVFKESRVEIPDAPPRLDAREALDIQKVAKINNELANWIKENGVKPGDERAVLLSDGTRVILKYVGEPYEEVDANNLKKNKKLIERGDDTATDFQRKNAEFDDDAHEKREELIHKTNQKWAWGRIIAFFTSTYFLVFVGLIVASIFFPVLLPVVKLFWQLSKAGFGAFKVVAGLGVNGITSLVKNVEAFRNAHKNDEIGKEFDTHMSKAMDVKEKTALDQLKNHFDI